VLAGAVSWAALLSSWLGGDLLADEIPIASGHVSVDVTQAVPETLTFTVPDKFEGFSWVPDAADHPLAKFGQQISVQVEVQSSVLETDWQVQIAWFQIQEWVHDEVAQSVEVTAVGLGQIAADAKFTAPQAPQTTDTFVSAFTRLLPTSLGVNFDPALADRALPQSFQWDQDRLGALYDIADAWPARLRVDEFGTVQVLPPLPLITTPQLVFTQGERGTLISAPQSDTRDQIYNVVVVQSSATDDPAMTPIQAVAQVTGGPFDPTGPYGAVVRYYSSPLVTTVVQCQSAAKQILRQSLLPAMTKDATIAPDPRIELDDTVKIVELTDPADPDSDPLVTLGVVVGYTLPLTVEDGAMTVTVGQQI
jgi:hypothetical protein